MVMALVEDDVSACWFVHSCLVLRQPVGRWIRGERKSEGQEEGKSQHRRARALPAVWRGYSEPKGDATDVIFSNDDQKVIREKGGGVLLFGGASLGEGGAATVRTQGLSRKTVTRRLSILLRWGKIPWRCLGIVDGWIRLIFISRLMSDWSNRQEINPTSCLAGGRPRWCLMWYLCGYGWVLSGLFGGTQGGESGFGGDRRRRQPC